MTLYTRWNENGDKIKCDATQFDVVAELGYKLLGKPEAKGKVKEAKPKVKPEVKPKAKPEVVKEVKKEVKSEKDIVL